ncbi:MAG: tetratricopeptide repeat protein, partial [Tumebacillaceae bacterium]
HDQALPLLLRCLEAPLATWSIRLLHMQAACCCQVLKRYEQAREHYEIALREAVREQAQDDVLRCHIRLGEVAFACGEWSVALHEWQLALRELQRNEPPEDEPGLAYEVLLNLGKVCQQLGDAKSALRHYREALRVMGGGNPPLRKEAEAMFGIGKSCFRLKRYRVAQQCLCQATVQYDSARDRRSALKARLELARLLRVIGERALALHMLDECEQVARVLQDSELGAQIVCERAVIWQEQGRREQAVEGLSRALRCWSRLSLCGKGVMRLRLADLYAEGECYEAALREAERAAAELAEEGDHAELMKSYQLLTRLHKHLGDYKRASECVVRVNELMSRQIRGAGILT